MFAPPVRRALPTVGLETYLGVPTPSCFVKTTGSPRFLGSPFMNAPRSLTPAGPRRQASCGAPVLPSAFVTASAPTAGLSGLNHAARSLPVYASPRRVTSLDATLGTGWWLPLPGRVMLPAGLLREVSAECHVIASSSPRLGLAHNKFPIRCKKALVKHNSSIVITNPDGNQVHPP